MSLEVDTTVIKRMVEAGLFKPASPEQIAARPYNWENDVEDLDVIKDLVEENMSVTFSPEQWIAVVTEFLSQEKAEFKTLADENSNLLGLLMSMDDAYNAVRSRGDVPGLGRRMAEASIKKSLFKPATPEQQRIRIDDDPALKKEMETERNREAQWEEQRRNLAVEAERKRVLREQDPWKFDHTDLSKRGRNCRMCHRKMPTGERYLKLPYQGNYGSTHMAVCKNCVGQAQQALRENIGI